MSYQTLVCVGLRAVSPKGLSIQQKVLSFFMQSKHLERMSGKIKILYLETKVLLKQSTVRSWIA